MLGDSVCVSGEDNSSTLGFVSDSGVEVVLCYRCKLGDQKNQYIPK